MAAKPGAASGSALDRLPPAGKFGLGALFVALFGALYFVVFYGDVASEIAREKVRNGTLETDRSKAKSSKEAYQKDLDEKARREALAREQKKMLPDEPETPAFLSQLQGQATIAGITLTSWSPLEETVQEFYVKVPMKLTVTGRFHQLVKFFHLVGQLERITNIEDIKVKSTKAPAADGDEVLLDSESLATAFRSVKPGETASTTKRRGAK